MSQVSLASAEEYDDEVLAVAVSAVGMVPARDVDVDVSASGFLVAVEYEIVTESASEVSERLEAATEEDFEREIRNAANGVTDAFDEVVVSSLWDVEVERSSSKKKSGGDVLTPTVVAVLFFACLVCVLAAIVCCVRRRHRRDTWGQWPDEANFDDVVELPSRHGPPSSTPPKYLHDRDENDDDFVSQEPSYI